MLNLEEFIAQSLIQIVNGVAESQKRVAELGGKINPTGYVIQPSGQLNWHKEGYGTDSEIGQVVEFDVAVVAGENKDIQGGMGVFVAGVTIGYKAEKANENSSVSRVKFSVPLFLPQQKKE
jgi:hypothetical protein